MSYSYAPDGELRTRSDATGTTSFSYDALDRMTTKTLPDTTVMSFDYDAASNLTQLDDGAGALSYGYDHLNLIETLTDADNEVTSFVHDKNYRRTETSYPNGVTEVTEYLNSGRVKSIKGIRDLEGPNEATLTSFSYDYTDPDSGADSSLRHQVTRGNGDVTSYDYDQLNRLTEAELRDSGGALIDHNAYGYDRNSNRTEKTVNSQLTSYVYNASNQLCWSLSGASSAACASPPGGATSYSHDGNGNLTGSSEGLALSYNDANQTTSMTPPGGSASAMSYADIAQDERVSAGDKTFAYNLLGLGLESQAGAETQYVRDHTGELISQRSSGGSEYLLFDALGSVVALTDDTGAVVARYDYDPYGELTSQSGVSDTPWRFAGVYYDEATELTKFGTRYYSAELGRWTQEDPVKGSIANSLTLNPYVYAGQDPTNNSDPTGRFFDLSWESVGEFVASQLMGTLVGGSVAVACWGVAAFFTAGTALTVATYGCYLAGRAVGFWVAHEARERI